MNYKMDYMTGVYAFHVTIVAPLLMWIGYNKCETSEDIFQLVLLIGVMALVYHSFRLYQKLTFG